MNDENFKRWKNQALEYCMEIYEDYTREEIARFSSSIQRAWKVGQRARKEKEKIGQRMIGLAKP